MQLIRIQAVMVHTTGVTPIVNSVKNDYFLAESLHVMRNYITYSLTPRFMYNKGTRAVDCLALGHSMSLTNNIILLLW